MTTAYEPITCPHYDLLTTAEMEQTVQGYRGNLTRSLVENAPQVGSDKRRNRKNLAARAGYMSALYAMRMMSQPPAVCRARSVRLVQYQIDMAIRELEKQQES